MNKTNDITEKQTTGYGYDELKDFDMGYRDHKQSKITPFIGRLRWSNLEAQYTGKRSLMDN